MHTFSIRRFHHSERDGQSFFIVPIVLKSPYPISNARIFTLAIPARIREPSHPLPFPPTFLHTLKSPVPVKLVPPVWTPPLVPFRSGLFFRLVIAFQYPPSKMLGPFKPLYSYYLPIYHRYSKLFFAMANRSSSIIGFREPVIVSCEKPCLLSTF